MSLTPTRLAALRSAATDELEAYGTVYHHRSMATVVIGSELVYRKVEARIIVALRWLWEHGYVDVLWGDLPGRRFGGRIVLTDDGVAALRAAEVTS